MHEESEIKVVVKDVIKIALNLEVINEFEE